MANTVKVEFTEQEVEQLLLNAQRGFASASSLSREQQATFNRAVGKLQIAWADALNPTQKRPYTRRAAKGTGKVGRPRKNAAAKEVPAPEG